MRVRQPPYASRSDRLIGQIIDALVAAIPAILVVTLLDGEGTIGRLTDINESMLGLSFAERVAAFLSIMYYLLADALPGGQSLAKRWIGTAVVDANSGEPCSVWQSLGRNALLAALGPIDWLFILGERHQRLGDKLAGTIVVRTD